MAKTSATNARIFVDILSENHPIWPTLLPDGMVFAHKVDIGGRHGAGGSSIGGSGAEWV